MTIFHRNPFFPEKNTTISKKGGGGNIAANIKKDDKPEIMNTKRKSSFAKLQILTAIFHLFIPTKLNRKGSFPW